jgi:hypothetical protein
MPNSLERYLREELRRRAFARLEAGVRAGSDLMCTILKEVVSGAPGEDLRREARSGSPFVYMDRQTGRVRSRRPSEKGIANVRDKAPGVDSGAGRASICFEIIRRDEAAGTITVRIGVDASAPGGTDMQSYMLAHDMGIRYPTRGPAKGSGAVIQRPWLRAGIKKYWSEFAAEVILVSRGLA